MTTNSVDEAEDFRLVEKNRSDVAEEEETYTFEEAIESVGAGFYQTLLLLYVGFAWICDAMEMMLLSYIGNAADCQWGITSVQKSLLTSVVFVGMCIGSYVWGLVADNEGRKTGFFATAVFTVVWGYASAFAPNFVVLVIFRGFVGFGLGGIHVAFSLFLEFTPTSSRGRYATALQGFWTIGTLIQAGLSWATLSTLGWRYLLFFSATPFIFMFIFYPLLSESPRYLLIKGQLDEVEKVIQTIAKVNRSKLPHGHLKAIQKTPHSASVEERGSAGPQYLSYHIKKVFFGMFREFNQLFSRSFRRTTSLLLVIWFTNALVYYGVVQFTTELHTEDELQECRESDKLDLEDREYLEIFIDSAAELVGFGFVFFAIDYFGRKTTLIITMMSCALSWWILPFNHSETYETIFLFFARAAITGSFNVIYVYTPELFPTTIRSFGLGICVSLSRIGGMVSPIFSVLLVDAGQTTLVEIVFGAFCLFAGLAAAFIPIETKGKTLQDTVHIEMAGRAITLGAASRNREQNSDEEINPL